MLSAAENYKPLGNSSYVLLVSGRDEIFGYRISHDCVQSYPIK